MSDLDSLTFAKPTTQDGTSIGLGCRLRLPNGSIIKVSSIIFSTDDVLVTGQVLTADQKHFWNISEGVSSAEVDTLQNLEFDKRLTPKEYIRARALDVEGKTAKDFQQAMIDDLLDRQQKLLASHS